MHKLTCATGLALASLSLAACSKPATTSAAGSTTTAAPTSGGGDTTTTLGDVPSLKPGLWQTTMNVKGMTSGMVTKMCLDEGLTKKFAAMATNNSGKADCAQVSATHSGGIFDITTRCKSGGVTVNNKMHMEMIGDDAYQETVEQSYEPKTTEPTTETVAGKYLGACTAGMKAGDLDMGGGVKMNMYDQAAKQKG